MTFAASVDRGNFEQILLNFVQNAAEAGAKNLAIRLRSQDLEVAPVDGRQIQHAVVIEVEDDGRGMSPEVARRIFDPFFTTKFPGRGLGLAVVFGGVRRHGGRVHAESAESGGTRFIVELPQADRRVVELPRSVLQINVDAPLRLPPETCAVIVDDEPIVRQVLLAIFDRLGILAHSCGGGAEALACIEGLRDRRHCIAFVDLTMPEMDGEEVVQRIRAATGEVRVVLMSGHADDTIDETADRMQPDGVLRKPFSLEDVRSVLRGAAGVELGQ